MKCKECGSEILSTDRFCGICGAPNMPIDSVAALSEETEAAEETEASVFNTDKAAVNTADAAVTAEESDNKAAEPAEPVKITDAPNTAETSNPTLPPYGYRYENNGTAAPFNYSQQMPDSFKNVKTEKEKKVVSLSVAILCIAAVFVLAIICGVLMQMYINKGVKTNKRSEMSALSEKSVSCLAEREQTSELIFL